MGIYPKPYPKMLIIKYKHQYTITPWSQPSYHSGTLLNPPILSCLITLASPGPSSFPFLPVYLSQSSSGLASLTTNMDTKADLNYFLTNILTFLHSYHYSIFTWFTHILTLGHFHVQPFLFQAARENLTSIWHSDPSSSPFIYMWQLLHISYTTKLKIFTYSSSLFILFLS